MKHDEEVAPDDVTGFPVKDGEQPNEAGSDEEFASRIKTLLDEAVTFAESELSPRRVKALNEYKGMPYGNEEDGRSQIISTEIRDTIQAMLPSLMRIFVGPEKVVEFRPRRADQEAMARQMTDYINFIFMEDNDGFMITHNVIKTAAICLWGPVKWWWEESEETESYEADLTPEQLALLAQDPTIVAIEEVPSGYDMAAGEPESKRVKVTRKSGDGIARIAALPPEEFLINREARSVEDATIVAHMRRVHVSDLVAMGYDEDEIEEHAGVGAQFNLLNERSARSEGADMGLEATAADDSMEEVLYCEAYVYADRNGDGIAELWKVCTVGNEHTPIHEEEVAERPFCLAMFDPEPFTLMAQDVWAMTEDLQRVKTAVVRGTLDSLALSLHPRTEVVMGQVRMEDVLNTEIGAVIRVNAPGMVRPFEHPFVGAASFPMLEYLDQVKENRVGITKAAAGLDADALQSSTKAAVAATLSASQQRIELFARTLAETFFKPMFKGVLRMVIQHQNKPRMIRLRNEYVEIDPASWNASMDVVVNVALGQGMMEERMLALTGIAAKQEQILQTLGPDNPLVSVVQYRNTLARMVEMIGYKNSAEFFKPVTEEQLQALKQQAEQQPKEPEPEMIIAQAEAAKAQAEVMMKQQELQLKAREMALKEREMALKEQELLLRDDRERDKIEVEASLKAHELAGKTDLTVMEANIKMILERDRLESQEKIAEMQARNNRKMKKSVKLERGADGRVSSAAVVEEPAEELNNGE